MAAVSWGNTDLWLAAVAIGSNLERRDLGSIVSGERQPTSAEYDILATALNEELSEHGRDHPVRLLRESP